MITRFLIMALLGAIVAGCQSWTLVEAKPYTLASGYTVEPTRTWSAIKIGNTHHMTIDGPGLQRLIISTDVQPGDKLIDIAVAPGSEAGKAFPEYSAGLSPIEIVELIDNTLEAWDSSQIVKSNIRQDDLNGETATVFDLSMVSSDGLNYRGFVYAVQREESFQLFLYYGTDLFHYEKNADDALAIIKSITWPQKET